MIEEDADNLRILTIDAAGGFSTVDIEAIGDNPVDLDLADVYGDGDAVRTPSC